MSLIQNAKKYFLVFIFVLAWFCVSCSSSTEADAHLFEDGIHVDILERVGEETIDYIENELEVPIHRGDDPPDIEALVEAGHESETGSGQKDLNGSSMEKILATDHWDFYAWRILHALVEKYDTGHCPCVKGDDGIVRLQPRHFSFRTYNYGGGGDDYSLDVALWRSGPLRMNPTAFWDEIAPWHSSDALGGTEAALIIGSDDSFTVFAVMDWDRSDDRTGEEEFLLTVSGTAESGRIDFVSIAWVNLAPGIEYWPANTGFHLYSERGFAIASGGTYQ